MTETIIKYRSKSAVSSHNSLSRMCIVVCFILISNHVFSQTKIVKDTIWSDRIENKVTYKYTFYYKVISSTLSGVVLQKIDTTKTFTNQKNLGFNRIAKNRKAYLKL